MKWIATINRLMIYASVIDIVTVRLLCTKKTKRAYQGETLKMQIAEYAFNSLSGRELQGMHQLLMVLPFLSLETKRSLKRCEITRDINSFDK